MLLKVKCDVGYLAPRQGVKRLNQRDTKKDRQGGKKGIKEAELTAVVTMESFVSQAAGGCGTTVLYKGQVYSGKRIRYV